MIRIPFLWLYLVFICLGFAASTRSASVQAEEGCSKLCKPAYIGDKNCDSECFNSACKWDGGDCDDQWELRRMIVMGPYYKSVDHVEYTLVGPGGQTKQISYEEGRQWEGADIDSKGMENDWISLLDADDEDNLPEPGKRTYQHAPWKKEGVEVTL
eukprot:jgi/Tetstr1/437794/TSEL_002834.t1